MSSVTFSLRDGQPVSQYKAGAFHHLERKAIAAATTLIETVETRVADTLAVDGSDIDNDPRKGCVSLDQRLSWSRSNRPEINVKHANVGATELEKSPRANPEIPGELSRVQQFRSHGEGFHETVGYNREGATEVFEQFLIPNGDPTMRVTRNLKTDTIVLEDLMGGILPNIEA